MACRDGMCGGCERCWPDSGDYEGFRNQDAFTDDAKHSLVAAAHDLVKRGNVNEKELRALEVLLAVFDPQEEVAEESDVSF